MIRYWLTSRCMKSLGPSTSAARRNLRYPDSQCLGPVLHRSRVRLLLRSSAGDGLCQKGKRVLTHCRSHAARPRAAALFVTSDTIFPRFPAGILSFELSLISKLTSILAYTRPRLECIAFMPVQLDVQMSSCSRLSFPTKDTQRMKTLSDTACRWRRHPSNVGGRMGF